MAVLQNIRIYIKKLITSLNFFKKNGNIALFDEIARRAFVNNAFDGALTLLGILMSNIILEDIQPLSIITTGFAACLAMGMSGSFGRYFSEQAERKRALRQIESYMFTDLSGSILEQESEKKVFLISLIDGLSPAMAAAIPIIPFFLAYAAIISVGTGVIISFVLDFLILFILGVFLGRLSGENIIKHGLLVVGVGFLTGIIIFFSSIFLNT